MQNDEDVIKMYSILVMYPAWPKVIWTMFAFKHTLLLCADSFDIINKPSADCALVKWFHNNLLVSLTERNISLALSCLSSDLLLRKMVSFTFTAIVNLFCLEVLLKFDGKKNSVK